MEEIKKFVIENPKEFNKERIEKMIRRILEFARIDIKGNVYFIDDRIHGLDKMKLILATRYLGSKFGELDKKSKIKSNIRSVKVKDFAKMLDISQDSARARMSQLVKQKFAYRISRGEIRVFKENIEKFIEKLERGERSKESKTKKSAPIIKKYKKIGERIIKPKIIYSKLEEVLNLKKEQIAKIILIDRSGNIKLKDIKGKTKGEMQRKCSLIGAYIYLMGFKKEYINSRFLTKICKESNIDYRKMKDTIKYMKRRGVIDNTEEFSTTYFLKEKGKKEAKIILMEILEKVYKKDSLPEEEIYDEGDQYSFYKDLKKMLSSSEKEIFIVDSYLNEDLLNLYLEKVQKKINVKILTNSKTPKKNFPKVARMFSKKHKGNFEVRESEKCHDRCIFIDEHAWVIGQSIKDQAKNKPSYLRKIKNVKEFFKTQEKIWKKAKKIP